MAVRQQNSRKVASLIIFLAFWFLISSSDLRQILGTILVPLLTPKSQIRVSELNTKTVAKTEHDERTEMMHQISEHCLPKLVCELYAKDSVAGEALADSEKSLMALIGSSSLTTSTPTKYHHASYVGQLIQGFEGQGCHHFYPMCPFSGDDVQQIARKVILK